MNIYLNFLPKTLGDTKLLKIVSRILQENEWKSSSLYHQCLNTQHSVQRKQP